MLAMLDVGKPVGGGLELRVWFNVVGVVFGKVMG